MKPIVLLSGQPGAGKTTVAKELVKISRVRIWTTDIKVTGPV
ncbi:MAG TPA: AAA family ATPase [Mucilaginibacter sp.]|nr:AAA family ATPase [Mucilaginibacter sp.]